MSDEKNEDQSGTIDPPDNNRSESGASLRVEEDAAVEPGTIDPPDNN